ncbi:sensor domain-containing diguanylate cyclase [Gorillibacterium sp. sgz5001074]|uniref:sensor domain-containing diguanylate cyclase n=1 Tax=Gorillibacterium sp. sgz5001074 TaxID=3446695 RepID=UPI003F67DD5D
MLDSLSRILGLHTLKIRLRFWVSSIIVMLGLLILGSTYLQEATTRTRDTNRQLIETADIQRLSIENWISDHAAQIRYLAKMLSGPEKNREQIAQWFSTFIGSQDQFAAVVYVDKTGVTAVDSDGSPGVNVREREYFEAARQGRELVTDIMIGKTSGKPIVLFSSPVSDKEGRFNGLVFGSIRIETLEKLMDLYDFGDSGETYLLDRSGRFITSPRHYPVRSLEDTNHSEIYERASSGQAEESSYLNYRGVQVIGEAIWIKDHQWIIVAEREHAAVFKPLYRNMWTTCGIVLGVLGLSIWLILALTRRIERPIRFLLVGTKIMRDGNYDYRIAPEEIESAPVELKQLCDTFNLTAQKLKSTIQMLEQSAVIDQLTEVYNRRFIMNEGNMLLETCIRAEQPCSVLMIDIDFFKKVNDTYGHLVGDRVIIHAASILMSCIRSCDMVSRYGGEEFLILAPNTGAAPGGLQLGERIRQEFEDHPYREEALSIPLTVSIGVSDYRSGGSFGKTALEDMISRADEALYKAKRSGRNRVESLEAADETGRK